MACSEQHHSTATTNGTSIHRKSSKQLREKASLWAFLIIIQQILYYVHTMTQHIVGKLTAQFFMSRPWDATLCHHISLRQIITYRPLPSICRQDRQTQAFFNKQRYTMHFMLHSFLRFVPEIKLQAPKRYKLQAGKCQFVGIYSNERFGGDGGEA